jgi:hypothetical protein
VRFVLAVAFAVAAATLVLFASTTAFAQDAGEERARAHFRRGVALYDGPPPDYEGALLEFRAAYAQKPVPSIKRNIALCLRGLKRNVAAIETLEQMLLEGGDKIKPEVRDAARKAITEMSAQIATVRLKVIVPAATPTAYEVALDGLLLPPEKAAQPVRMAPGEHTFVARARGYNDGFARVVVAAGQEDVPAQIELSPSSARGNLHVRSSIATATIAIDGVPLAQGEWRGELGAGVHRVEVTSPGVSAWGKDVTVVAAQTIELEARPGEAVAFDAPPPVIVPQRLPAPVHDWIFMAGISVHEGTRILNPAAFFEGAPTERGFWGGGAVIKGVRKVGPIVLLEAWSELGGMTPTKYDTNGGTKAEVGVAYFELGPALRLRSKGKTFRAIGGVAAGLEVESVTAKVKDLNLKEVTQKGAGVTGCFLFEAGFQLYVSKRAFIELDGFYNVYGVGAATTSGGARFFLDSPESRGGVRTMIGLEL